jgi:hypothetical protein
VNEYITKFTQLSRYAPNEVYTDEKKQDYFMNDLNDGLTYAFTLVLFDYRASHSFISATYVGKHNLPLALLKCQMIVSSLGGDMPVRQLCPKVILIVMFPLLVKL